LVLLVVGVECSATGDNEPPSPGAAGATSAPVTFTNTRRLRRLSNREFNNVVRDLLGDTSRPADRFLRDSYPNDYDNGSVGLTVQAEQVEAYQNAAEALAAQAVASRLPQLLDGCDPGTQGAESCADAFFASFPARAYRRPLFAAEMQRLRDIFAVGQQGGGGLSAGIQLVLETIFQSPQFLYREELGDADPAAMPAPGVVRLTDYEVASELSFLLTGTLPDQALLAAADAGLLRTTDDLQREAGRLLATAGAQETMRAFLHQWMATDRLAVTTKDPAVYPAYTPVLATSMSGELDRYYDAVAWGPAGSLRELFTSTQSFIDQPLGALYGVDAPLTDFQSVTLDPAVRKGILTRAGYLTVHAASDSSGPVSRGVFLLDRILCAPPPQPPANVPPASPAAQAIADHLTTRQRFQQHEATPFCHSCHQIIDGVGFGFEEFDGTGVYRTTENGVAVDPTGALVGSGDVDGPYSGVSALAERIVDSKRLPQCYLRQVYRFAMGQVEIPDDQALFDALSRGWGADARMTDALLSLVASPVFVQRTTVGGDSP
jgi:hypothetical protein